MQILYADVLFAVNAAMDFLSLYLAIRLARRTMRPGRMLIAAAIGGVWGVLALFLEQWPLLQGACQLATALLMCYIGCGKPFLGLTALFYGISLLMGGGMTALWSAINRWQGAPPLPATPQPSGRLSPRLLLLLALLCGIGALLLGSMARKRRMRAEATLTITVNGHTHTLSGICDTANFLTEPLSGLPVILLPPSEGKHLLPPNLLGLMQDRSLSGMAGLPRTLSRSLRLIPGSDATGSFLLPAIKPELCLVDGCETEAYIAFAPSSAALPAAIIPADLIPHRPLAEGSPSTPSAPHTPSPPSPRRNAK